MKLDYNSFFVEQKSHLPSDDMFKFKKKQKKLSILYCERLLKMIQLEPLIQNIGM